MVEQQSSFVAECSNMFHNIISEEQGPIYVLQGVKNKIIQDISVSKKRNMNFAR